MRFVLSTSVIVLLLSLLVLPCLNGQNGDSVETRLELGAFCGIAYVDDGFNDPRLGVQSDLGRGRFGFSLAFAVIDRELYMEWSGGAWQLYLLGRYRPLGNRSWLSLGYGLTMQHRWANWDFVTSHSIYSRTDVRDAASIAVAVPVGRLRPLVDVLMTPFFYQSGPVAGHVLIGIAVVVL